MRIPTGFLSSAALTLAGAALPFLTTSPAMADSTALNLVKECSSFDGKPGTFCSITDSSFAAIPVGSKVFYYGT